MQGLIVAGSADLKTELSESLMLDPRLKKSILATFDIAYGGIPGLHEAISKAAPLLSNLKLVSDSELIAAFFEEIAKDTGHVAIGLNETLRAIELKAVDKLICWNEIRTVRTVLRSTRDASKERVVFVEPGTDVTRMLDSDHDAVGEQTPLATWITESYRTFGLDPSQVHFVSNQSSEGAQFCRSFGIGAVLHYHIDWSTAALDNQINEGNDDDDIADTLSEFV